MDTTLVVVADARRLESLVTRLRHKGIDAYGVRAFEGGREQLIRRRWDLLVADVRLGAYNGLQLALRARVTQPEIAIILVGDGSDPALDAEAASLRAEYVVWAGPEHLSGIVAEACRRARPSGQDGRGAPEAEGSIDAGA
jgi:DNA-binding response OmpR family regulator